MRLLPLPLLIALTACKQAPDADGDGFPEGMDCDDELQSVYPSAPESCDGRDNDCDGLIDEDPVDGAVYWADLDGDGVAGNQLSISACEAGDGWLGDTGDCDDLDANTRPDADELCDGRDNDCDGTIDNDPIDEQTFYADADRDGFGDAASSTVGCEAPTGYVEDNTDCDDTSDNRHPTSSEFCDSIDNDCDGDVDEELPTWYLDVDGDGFGDPGNTVEACDKDETWLASGDDCDDGAADVYPDAPELCDGVDNDCDSSVDENPPTWYADADGDGWGDSSAGTLDCVAPPDTALSPGDCDDSEPTTNPSAPEICEDAVDNNCNGLLDANDPGVTDTLYWRDADGDSFGSLTTHQLACSDPGVGWVLVSGDCNDSDDTALPGGVEICDGADNDCDGLWDDDDPDATGLTDFYYDADRDGDGDVGAIAEAFCAQPTGYAATATDCQDFDPDAYGGATEVQDGKDNDCDDLCDEDFVSSGDVFFTEAMYNAWSGNHWLELFNAADFDIELCSGWTLTVAGNSVDLDGAVLPARSHFVVGTEGSPDQNDGVEVDFVSSGVAFGPSDGLDLQFDGSTINALTFSSLTPGGTAAQLSVGAYNAFDNTDPSNWCDADTVFGDPFNNEGYTATPGAMNTFCAGSGSGS